MFISLPHNSLQSTSSAGEEPKTQTSFTPQRTSTVASALKKHRWDGRFRHNTRWLARKNASWGKQNKKTPVQICSADLTPQTSRPPLRYGPRLSSRDQFCCGNVTAVWKEPTLSLNCDERKQEWNGKGKETPRVRSGPRRRQHSCCAHTASLLELKKINTNPALEQLKVQKSKRLRSLTTAVHVRSRGLMTLNQSFRIEICTTLTESW